MGFRDRFYTPTTAKAILSWRIVVGVAVGVVAGLIGLHPLLATCFGIAAYSSLVLLAVPRSATRAVIDPFTLSEPWRQLMQGAQGAGRKFRETVGSMPAGPLRDQLDDIDVQLQHALGEAWRVAKAGDEIDDVVRRLDPTTLRSKLATAQQRATSQPSPEHEQAVASLQGQLDSAERLRAASDETAATLRLTQTQLDELVARAAEVRIGAADTDAYAKDVDELVSNSRHSARRSRRRVSARELACCASQPHRRRRHGALPPDRAAARVRVRVRARADRAGRRVQARQRDARTSCTSCCSAGCCRRRSCRCSRRSTRDGDATRGDVRPTSCSRGGAC